MNAAAEPAPHFDLVNVPLDIDTHLTDVKSHNSAAAGCAAEGDETAADGCGCCCVSARTALLSSYALARWGGRCWEFSVALFLVELNQKSLLYAAVYGLLEDVLRLSLGSVVGGFIDRVDRFHAASTMCLLQNMSVFLSSLAAALALRSHDNPDKQALLAGFTVVLGAVGSVGSLGIQSALEADWPKALCADDSQALTNMNAVLRGVDMACMLVAPLVASVLMQFLGMLPAVIFLLLWNLLGTAPEVLLMKVAYDKSSNLRRPKTSSHPAALSISQPNDELPVTLPSRLRDKWNNFSLGWHIYMRQPVLLAALSLAFLYCTVLSLGYLMTGYIKMRGMGESQISIFRGMGAVTGLLSTLIFPKLVPRIGLKPCGLLGIYWQLGWLSLGTLPVILSHLGLLPSGSTTPTLYLLLVGLAMSRFGLWLFDMAVAQLMQEEVEEGSLGSVSAIQGSISSGMELLMFVLGVAAPHGSQFPWLMFVSLGVVALSAACFSTDCSRGRELGYSALQMSDTLGEEEKEQE